MILNTSEFDRNDNLTATLIDLKLNKVHIVIII